MATLECDHETVAGVTLVTCRLTSDVARQVTLEPTHDEPIWPPRRQSVPESGWHDDGWTGVVPADGIRALGYATPADPADPLARVAATEPPPDDPSISARDVVRSLGDPRPTRDAVPPTDAPDRSVADEGGVDSDDSTASVAVAPSEDAEPGRTPTRTDPSTVASGGGSPSSTDLDAIETRLWTARDLADVSTVAEARAAVERAGGLPAVRDLAAQLDEDREHLATVEERAARLAADADAVSIPVASLERLA